MKHVLPRLCRAWLRRARLTYVTLVTACLTYITLGLEWVSPSGWWPAMAAACVCMRLLATCGHARVCDVWPDSSTPRQHSSQEPDEAIISARKKRDLPHIATRSAHVQARVSHGTRHMYTTQDFHMPHHGTPRKPVTKTHGDGHTCQRGTWRVARASAIPPCP